MNLLRHIAGCFKPGGQAFDHERLPTTAGKAVERVRAGDDGVHRTTITTVSSGECSRHDAAGLTLSTSPSFTASILASTSPDAGAACYTSSAAAALAAEATGGATPRSGPGSQGCDGSAPTAVSAVSAAAAASAAPRQLPLGTGTSAAVVAAAAARTAQHGAMMQTAPAGRLLGLLPTAAGPDEIYGPTRRASGPGSSQPVFRGCDVRAGGADATAATAPAITELQVAFSAYNTRDICARDPTMRIRHLKVMASGPSAIVYKGTWQGMLVAVRFTLLKASCGAAAGAGPDIHGPAAAGGCGLHDLAARSSLGTSLHGHEHALQTAYRRVCAMLASHCTPQRSHCMRVYACDVSRVARTAAAAAAAVPAYAPGGEGVSDICSPAGLTVVACDWAAEGDTLETGLSSPQPHLLPYSIHSSLEDSVASSSSDTELFHWQAWAAEQQRCSSLAGSRQASGTYTSGHRVEDHERSGSSCCGSGSSSIYSAATAASAARGSVGAAVGVVGCGAAASAGSSATSRAHLPRSKSQPPAAAAASSTASRFHFSSVLCGCPPPASSSAAPTTAAQPHPLNPLQRPPPQQQQHEEPPLTTLQGLLAYLRAAPGDYLLHTVLEQGCCGDLRHGVRCGVYDAHGSGPVGPRGAMTNLVHSARGVAAGLQQLHQAGEVHGGLCPGNVLLQWSGPNSPVPAEEGDEVVLLAAAASGAAEPGSRGSGSSGGSGGRKRSRRGLFAARITDCGVRRLVLGPQWQQQLAEHADLLCCTAPELLPPPCADPTGVSRLASAEPQWQPHHDIYSFGCLLFLMCTGGLPNTHRLHTPAGSSGSNAAAASLPAADTGQEAAAAQWPANVWPPLRSLGEACMAADPALRPTASRVVQVLLLWESRLCSSRQQQLLQYDGTRAAPQQAARLNVSAPDFPALAAAAASRSSGGSSSGHVPAAAGARDGSGGAVAAAAGAGCSTVPAAAVAVHPRMEHQQPPVAMRLPGRAGSGGGRGAGGCLVLGVGSGAFSHTHTLDSVAEAEMTACGSGVSSGAEERLKVDAEKRTARVATGASSSVVGRGDGGEKVRSAAPSPSHAHVAADPVCTPTRCVDAPAAAQAEQLALERPCLDQQGLRAAADAAAAMGQPVAASRSREGRSRVLQM